MSLDLQELERRIEEMHALVIRSETANNRSNDDWVITDDDRIISEVPFFCDALETLIAATRTMRHTLKCIADLDDSMVRKMANKFDVDPRTVAKFVYLEHGITDEGRSSTKGAE